jgi:hypothetical protein
MNLSNFDNFFKDSTVFIINIYRYFILLEVLWGLQVSGYNMSRGI